MTTDPLAAGATAYDVPHRLAEHLTLWAGTWPPREPLDVVANPLRAEPGWDGSVFPVAGVVTETEHAVLGVDPAHAAAVRALAVRSREPSTALADLLAGLPQALGRPGVGGRGSFRWSTDPAPLPEAGAWLPVEDERVPSWLHPFGGEALVALEDDHYLAGVGIKRHDVFGQELAVVTDEAARGRGLARRLVAQAARRVLDEGAIPTYLHAPDNTASARVAAAAGFPDRGWGVLGFFPLPVSATR